MKKQTQKHILGLLLLPVVFLIIDRTISFGLDTLILKSNFRYSKMYKGEMENEYLFIGNSRGVNSFYQPELQKLSGKKSYNISYNGLSVELCNILIQDYCQYNKKPKKIFFEVSAATTETSVELLENLKLYYGSSFKLDSIAKMSDQTSYNSQKVSHLFRYNSEFAFRVFYYLFKQDQSWINSGNISDYLIEEAEKMDSINFKLSEKSISEIKNIKHFCDQQGIELSLVLGPYLPAYSAKVKNLKEWIKQIEDASGQKIINFSSRIKEKENFADRLHINYQGGMNLAKIMFDENVFD